MSCPVNYSTVKKGIENKAAEMLTQSGQFERIDQTSLRLTSPTSNYNKTITDVNNAFGEEVVKKVENVYKIQPSDSLINTYLESAPVQKETTTPIKEGVEELFETNPELANAVYSKILANSGLSAENLLSLLLKDNLIEKQCS